MTARVRARSSEAAAELSQFDNDVVFRVSCHMWWHQMCCWWWTIADLQEQAQGCCHLFFTVSDFFRCSAVAVLSGCLPCCYATPRGHSHFFFWPNNVERTFHTKSLNKYTFSHCLLDTRIFPSCCRKINPSWVILTSSLNLVDLRVRAIFQYEGRETIIWNEFLEINIGVSIWKRHSRCLFEPCLCPPITWFRRFRNGDFNLDNIMHTLVENNTSGLRPWLIKLFISTISKMFVFYFQIGDKLLQSFNIHWKFERNSCIFHRLKHFTFRIENLYWIIT